MGKLMQRIADKCPSCNLNFQMHRKMPQPAGKTKVNVQNNKSNEET